MAAAIAEQRQHGADFRRNALDQPGQSVLAGAIHLAQQFIPNGTEVVLKGVAARKHCSSPYAEDAMQFSNERLTTAGRSRPGCLRPARESERPAAMRIGSNAPPSPKA